MTDDRGDTDEQCETKSANQEGDKSGGGQTGHSNWCRSKSCILVVTLEVGGRRGGQLDAYECLNLRA
jgi:hypothetical protein